MSAEVENNKDEETKEQPPKKSLKQKLRDHWQLLFKIVELILCALCMGFIYEPANTVGLGKSHMHHVGIMYTAYTGYMLINCVFLVSRAIGDRIPFKTASLFALNGAALFLITAILLTVNRSYIVNRHFFHPQIYLLNMFTTSIIFAFLNVIVFALDAILTFRRQEDF